MQLSFTTRSLTARDALRPDADAQAALRRRFLIGAASVAVIVYSKGIADAVQVMQEADVDLPQAVAAVRAARRTNIAGVFVLAEGVDKARVIRQAAETDAPGSIMVSSIRFTAVGGVSSAVIAPPMPGVTVQYTVSGTDGYYDSQTLQSEANGSVSFNIPAARQGVEDAISVTAVLSGRTASTTFFW